MNEKEFKYAKKALLIDSLVNIGNSILIVSWISWEKSTHKKKNFIYLLIYTISEDNIPMSWNNLEIVFLIYLKGKFSKIFFVFCFFKFLTASQILLSSNLRNLKNGLEFVDWFINAKNKWQNLPLQYLFFPQKYILDYRNLLSSLYAQKCKLFPIYIYIYIDR